MNYLIVDNNSVFIAKTDIAVLKAKIQRIELQKPMLSTWYINNQATEVAYCQQVICASRRIISWCRIINYVKKI